MVKIDFECPLCNETNNLVLMGNEYGEFNKHCKACKAPLEVSNKTNKIKVKAQFPKEIVKNTIRENKIPSDYKKYEMDQIALVLTHFGFKTKEAGDHKICLQRV